MSDAAWLSSAHSLESARAGSSNRIIDKFALMPMLACVYATIAFPLILTACSITDNACLLERRPESKIFWPALAAISIVLVAQNRARLRFPPHIVCLLCYLAFAGASVLWAFSPGLSLIRFAQQAMIITSIVLPGMLAGRRADMMRGLFVIFALAAFLNVCFVFSKPPIEEQFATWGYPGYFPGKNYLGECAAVALLLSFYEMLYSGWRRASGLIVAIMAVFLLFMSNSRTSLGLALLTPFLAALMLILRRKLRISPGIIFLSVLLCFATATTVFGFNSGRISYMLYGDSSFTGRTIIWDFANSEIARKPLFGWGYQSFWLAGPDAPSIVDAPGWIKTMPNAHNGYLDTKIEMGYIGYALLIAFIATTMHAIGRVGDRDRARAWLMLSLALFIIITNGLESFWMRGFEMLWVVFVILAAEAGRYWTPFLPVGRAYGSRGATARGPTPVVRGPRPRGRLIGAGMGTGQRSRSVVNCSTSHSAP